MTGALGHTDAGRGAGRGTAGRWLLGIVLAAVALGLWWRVRALGIMPLYGDEYHGARVTSYPWRQILVTYDLYGTHVPLPLLQRLCSWLSNPGVLAFRMPAVVAGVLTLVCFYPLTRGLVGRPAAALATVALAASPMHVYYTRFGRAYSITILLGLPLLVLLHRAELRRWRGPWLLFAIGVLAAVTPWVHLSAAGFVAALGLVAIGLAWARGGWREALRPLVVFALAAGACALLFAPVMDAVIEYATKLPDERRASPQGIFGITTLLAGGVTAGLVWVVALPLAAVLLWRREQALSALLVAAILGPTVFLLATMPHGMEYAYARYLLNAIPAMLLLLSWLLVRLCGPRVGVSLGLVLVAVVWITGPQGPLRPEERSFANTYLALRSLPAFDQRFRFTSEVYDLIAEDDEAAVIIESPVIHSRAVLLYRNYFLTHGKDVVMGVISPDDVRLNGPYAFIGDPQVGSETGARYLVVHKDIEYELGVYWKTVYDNLLPKVESRWNRGMMERHRTYFLNSGLKEMVDVLAPALENQLGAPFFEDERVYCWKLKDRSRGGGRRSRQRAQAAEGEQP